MASAMPEASYSWWSVVGGDSGEDVMVEETDRIMVSSSSQFLHIPIPLSLLLYFILHLQLFGGNGTLLIAMVTRDDAGIYFCIASNSYGNISSNYLTLRVSGESLSLSHIARTAHVHAHTHTHAYSHAHADYAHTNLSSPPLSLPLPLPPSLPLPGAAVPLAPDGVTLSSLTSSSATVQWDHITSAYPPVHVRGHTRCL